MAATPANIAFMGSLLFALFLIGWGLSFLWGPLADRFGRARCLAVRRNYRASTITFAAQLARLKRLGY